MFQSVAPFLEDLPQNPVCVVHWHMASTKNGGQSILINWLLLLSKAAYAIHRQPEALLLLRFNGLIIFL